MTVAPKHGESRAIPVDRRTDAQWIGGKPSVLIFDVNETLIDFESIIREAHRVMESNEARGKMVVVL